MSKFKFTEQELKELDKSKFEYEIASSDFCSCGCNDEDNCCCDYIEWGYSNDEALEDETRIICNKFPRLKNHISKIENFIREW